MKVYSAYPQNNNYNKQELKFTQKKYNSAMNADSFVGNKKFSQVSFGANDENLLTRIMHSKAFSSKFEAPYIELIQGQKTYYGYEKGCLVDVMFGTEKSLELLEKLKNDRKVSNEFKARILLNNKNEALIDRIRASRGINKDLRENRDFYLKNNLMYENTSLKLATAILDASPDDVTTRLLLTTGMQHYIPMHFAGPDEVELLCNSAKDTQTVVRQLTARAWDGTLPIQMPEATLETKLALLSASPDIYTVRVQLCTPDMYGKTEFSKADKETREKYLQYCDNETAEILTKNPDITIRSLKMVRAIDIPKIPPKIEDDSSNIGIKKFFQKRTSKTQVQKFDDEVSQRKQFYENALWSSFRVTEKIHPILLEEVQMPVQQTGQNLPYSQDWEILDALKSLKDDELLTTKEKEELLLRDENLALFSRCFEDHSYFCGSHPDFNLAIIEAMFDVIPTEEMAEKLLFTRHNGALPVEAATYQSLNSNIPIFKRIVALLLSKVPNDKAMARLKSEAGTAAFQYYEKLQILPSSNELKA